MWICLSVDECKLVALLLANASYSSERVILQFSSPPPPPPQFFRINVFSHKTTRCITPIWPYIFVVVVICAFVHSLKYIKLFCFRNIKSLFIRLGLSILWYTILVFWFSWCINCFFVKSNLLMVIYKYNLLNSIKHILDVVLLKKLCSSQTLHPLK